MKRRVIGTGFGLVLLAGLLQLAGAPAALAVGTLTNVSWAVSNNQVSATGVQYTYNFTTATSGLITSVTMTVPTGTAGTPTVVQNVGIGAGTVSRSGTTITYTVTTPATVAAGIPVMLAFGGLTNTGTAGTNTSTVTTNVLSLVALDSGTSNSVTFGATNTAVSVNVAESTVFSTDTSSYTLDMDPSFSSLATQTKAVTLSITSNAGHGYTLNVKDTGLTTGTFTIPGASSGMATAAAWPSGSHYGYSTTLTGTTGSPSLGGTLGTSGNYAGYTGGGENILTATGATGQSGHTLVMTNKVEVDYAAAAGTYSDTVTYTLTPSY
jgi:hypothetical protein